MKQQISKAIAINRRARFDYAITDTFEAGIVLVGSEVKSLRQGKSSIAEAFVGEVSEGGTVGLYLLNATISEYTGANQFNHDPKRPRQLLVHRRQMNKMLGDIRRKGITIIPLRLYFNDRGRAKIEIGIAKGKKNFDKREAIKERDWKREQSRIYKNNDS